MKKANSQTTDPRENSLALDLRFFFNPPQYSGSAEVRATWQAILVSGALCIGAAAVASLGCNSRTGTGATSGEAPPVATQQSRVLPGHPTGNPSTNVLTQAIGALHEFTRVAKVYNFDGTITHSSVTTNRNGTISVRLQTPTHYCSMTGERIDKLVSSRDSIGAPHDPDAISKWHACTGTWTREGAVAETFAILQRLQDETTLRAVRGGRVDYKATPMRLRTPAGDPVTVIPFHVVELYEPDDTSRRVRVEFRMGSNGPAGVTDFFRWP